MRTKDLKAMLPATSEVDAIWPCTSAAGGESTALLLTSGEVAVFENCSSWSLATVYAQRAGRDLRTLRTLTGELFGDTKACVLPITLSLVLVALKYRRPGYGSRQATVCYVNYGVTFAMSEPQVVSGSDAIALFKGLAAQSKAPRWNFFKYVVDRQGKVVASFSSLTKPDDPELIAAIEQAIASQP